MSLQKLESLEDINFKKLPRYLHGKMMYIVLVGLNNGGSLNRSQFSEDFDTAICNMTDLGVLIRLNPGQYRLNMDVVRKICYVVPDDVFLKFTDPEYVYNLKKESGMYRKNRTYEEQRAIWNKRSELKRARKKKAQEEITPVKGFLPNILFPDELKRRSKEGNGS